MLFRNSTSRLVKYAAACSTLLSATGGIAAIPKAAPAPTSAELTYADVADLFAAVPLIVHVQIATATVINGPPRDDAAVRYYVTGDVKALIRGTQAVAPRLAWLVDMRPDSRGKFPKLKKVQMLLAALPVAGRPGEIRLAARDAQQPWTPALDARVRALVASVGASDAPPPVTAVAGAFHSPGTIVGEGETQIFLTTATGAPVSITVLSRPGQPKRWAYAIGEIVDEAAAPPAPDTLGWYRLACFLPRSLPSTASAELASQAAAAAQTDYAFVVDALGTCTRTRR